MIITDHENEKPAGWATCRLDGGETIQICERGFGSGSRNLLTAIRIFLAVGVDVDNRHWRAFRLLAGIFPVDLAAAVIDVDIIAVPPIDRSAAENLFFGFAFWVQHAVDKTAVAIVIRIAIVITDTIVIAPVVRVAVVGIPGVPVDV